jgi:hypothetical protein
VLYPQRFLEEGLMSIYRVEKTELPVIVFQADGSVMKGVVFLSAATYNHMRTQSLNDLLNEPGDFFPFRNESGDFCITNKQTITHIRFEPRESDHGQASLGHREDVEVRFVGGEQLTGSVSIAMPEGRSRLFDFINAMEGFFLLQTQEAHYLVNVRQLRDVSPRS